MLSAMMLSEEKLSSVGDIKFISLSFATHLTNLHWLFLYVILSARLIFVLEVF